MGYDIWIEREGAPIRPEEWNDILANDEDLVGSGNETNIAAMYFDLEMQIFYYTKHGGRIFVRKPKRIVLEKMLAIARKLNARVIGDDGEIYDDRGVPDRPSQFKIE